MLLSFSEFFCGAMPQICPRLLQFFTFLDYTIIHTHAHTCLHTQGRTPLNEWSAYCREGCLHIHALRGFRTHNLSNRSAGIATRYGLEVPGIEWPWGRDIPHSSTPALGPTQAPIQWTPVHGLDHPNPTSAKVREREELFLYFILGFRGQF